jgi:hypothetical protein
MFFAEEIAEKSSILFKNESEEDYDEMINLYNILIKCKYKSEKMYKDKDKKMMFPLINFKTTSILEYKFENPIHIYFVYELDMLVINDDRKDIIRLERSLVINLLFDLIKKGTYFYIQYADDVVKSTIMDDYGTLYRSYFLMGEKNIGKKLSLMNFTAKLINFHYSYQTRDEIIIEVYCKDILGNLLKAVNAELINNTIHLTYDIPPNHTQNIYSGIITELEKYLTPLGYKGCFKFSTHSRNLYFYHYDCQLSW